MLTRHYRALATEHLHTLARKHKITLRPARDYTAAQSYAKARTAWVPEIRTASDYLCALHEFGHIVDADSRRYGRRLTRQSGKPSSHREIMHEAAAWSWAVQTARPSILRSATRADWARIGVCFTSYLAC